MISAKSIILNAMKDGRKINFLSTDEGVAYFDLNLKIASQAAISFTDRDNNDHSSLVFYDEVAAISTGFTVPV